jgi:hypothetical protein
MFKTPSAVSWVVFFAGMGVLIYAELYNCGLLKWVGLGIMGCVILISYLRVLYKSRRMIR